MNNATLSIAGIVLIASAVAISFSGGDSPIMPRPEPENPGGPNLVAAFDRSDDKAQAAFDGCHFGCLCDAIADMIERDGRQSEPQLRTGVQLDNLRSLSRFYQAGGLSYAEQYPSLAATAGKFLTDELGTDGGPLTEQQRAKWVASYRKLAKSAHYAAEYLEWKN